MATKQGNKKCVVYIRRISRSILQWCWAKLMEWLLPDSQVSWGPRNFSPPLQNPMTDQKAGVGAKQNEGENMCEFLHS